jgi:uridine kinase
VEEDTYPRDMKRWLNDGANLSALKTPKFVIAIHKLLSLGKSDFIFIEEPFGKERESMRSLINCVVLLDQPMEICFARVVSRSIHDPLSDSLKLLPKYLANYQDHYRDCYIKAVNQVRNNCDFSITDILSVEETVNLVNKKIMQR